MGKPYFLNYQTTHEVRDRINQYGLRDFVSLESDIVDVGCAEGLFCIGLSSSVKSATGIDPISEHFEAAQSYKQAYAAHNCSFIQQDFVTFCQNNTKQFHLVLCFAVHSYIIGTHARCHWDKGEMPMVDFKEFSDMLVNLVKPGGVLVIEGHPDFDKDHQDWEPLMKELQPNIELIKLTIGRPNRPLAFFRKHL